MNHLGIGRGEEHLLSRPNRPNHSLAAAGIELREHVVEQEDRVFSGLPDKIIGLGEFKGEADGSLLAARPERGKVAPVD